LKYESCFPQITLMNADQIEVFCENLPAGRLVCAISRKLEHFKTGLCIACIKALYIVPFRSLVVSTEFFKLC